MRMSTWVYDAILYIYALSLLFSFSDVMNRNRNAKRLGTGLLVFVWALQTAVIVYRVAGQRYIPVANMFEALFFYSWMIVTVSIMMHIALRLDLLLFLVNVAGFAILALNAFGNPTVAPISSRWSAEDELLFIHITFAIGSYVAFLIAALLSGMYLFLHRRLKERSWSAVLTRFPSLEKIELYTFRSVMVGVPLLILSVALGIVKVVLEEDIRLLADPKVLGSLVIAGAYIFYAVRRASGKHARETLAKWNLAAFSLVMANFVLSNYYSRFHQWMWM
jgi:HemX protein